jgi:hypothetical protein
MILGNFDRVNPNDLELSALAQVLLHRKGCSSFRSLRSCNGNIYDTFYFFVNRPFVNKLDDCAIEFD